MLKKKRKPYKRLLAVLMTAAMCLSMSLCSMASVSAAQTTKGEESSASDSSNTSDNSDNSDNADNSSSNNSESSSSSDDNKTNYDWSKNTTGNANLAADETIVMENGTYQLIAVTTRDDDVFYVIIDKTKTENNVYFLNEVDTADLDKLAKMTAMYQAEVRILQSLQPLPMKKHRQQIIPTVHHQATISI